MRLLHFFILPNSKSEREHETVALFEGFNQQKTSRTTRVVHFFKLSVSKNEPDHESGALF